MTIAVRLRQEWLALLEQEFEQEYMRQLGGFLRAEKAAGKVIYPAGTDFFAALEATPPSAVKVVILGQDPYHGPGQAHGLCFSVKPGVKPPPSLMNIYKELVSDIGMARPNHGFLEHWAQQGVLLSLIHI